MISVYQSLKTFKSPTFISFPYSVVVYENFSPCAIRDMWSKNTARRIVSWNNHEHTRCGRVFQIQRARLFFQSRWSKLSLQTFGLTSVGRVCPIMKSVLSTQDKVSGKNETISVMSNHSTICPLLWICFVISWNFFKPMGYEFVRKIHVSWTLHTPQSVHLSSLWYQC